MSFHDSDYNASDSDDTLNLQRRTLTRSLVAFDPRQAHSIYRAQGQPPLTNYGNVTFVDVKVYKPTQYNTGPGSSGAQGYLTAMCKSFIVVAVLSRWRRLCGHEAHCMRSPLDE